MRVKTRCEWKPNLTVHYEKSGCENVEAPAVLLLGVGLSLPTQDPTTTTSSVTSTSVSEDNESFWGFGDEAQPWADQLVYSLDLWREKVQYIVEEVIGEPVYIWGYVALYFAATHVPKSWKQQPLRHNIDETSVVLPVALFKSLRHFISQGRLSEGFRAFSLLLGRRHQSGSHELVLQSAASLLSTFVEFNEFLPGQQIHAHCISSGLEFDHVLVSKLVTFYSAFNLLHEAQTFTERSGGVFHPLPWNVLIGSYVRNKRFVEAVSAYKRMVSKGIKPDAFTYPSVLKACGALLWI
ncbi:unnamed protein product [Eruca vesicaria subsp. sativa]|uniref:Pentatricopeptide repeat-containing protein n=1 Tax=Eruca vesicaria subsp. sativa TaxID=29727 RepID=A0ABC8KAG5_ERUVS|nr:unnamed protein product [Eruca vesicaria subsp. sativa]